MPKCAGNIASACDAEKKHTAASVPISPSFITQTAVRRLRFTNGSDAVQIRPSLIPTSDIVTSRLWTYRDKAQAQRSKSMPPQLYHPLHQTSHDLPDYQDRSCTCPPSSSGQARQRVIYTLSVLLSISIIINGWLATRLRLSPSLSAVPSIGKRIDRIMQTGVQPCKPSNARKKSGPT